MDTILPLFINDDAKHQGLALDVIRTVSEVATWDTIKALINNFGVKESYHSLHQRILSARNCNIYDYFNKLNILSSLNENYKYDAQKPSGFKPQNNEKVGLNTFLTNSYQA